MRSIAELALEYINELDDRAKGGEKHYISSPFCDLDAIDPSWLHEGHLIVAAGRPGMGKTAFAQQVAEHSATDRTTIFYTLEMSGWEVTQRSICRRAGIPLYKLKDSSRLEQEDWKKIAAAGGELTATHMLVDDASFDVNSLCLKTKAAGAALEARGMPPLGLVVVDYLQLVSAGKRSNNRAEDVGAVSRGLKLLARDLSVPVFALSQLNRNLEGRVDKRPLMADLRESGAIEQDADLVLFIYRDEVYNDSSPDKGVAELIIGKNRHGATGVAKVAWLPERVAFGNLARSTTSSLAAARNLRTVPGSRGGNDNGRDAW
jgi:replicative DNA helicase